jgi:transposase
LASSPLVIDEAQIHDLDAQQLRAVVRTLIADVAGKDHEIASRQAFIDKLTHEMGVLKR